MTDLQTGFYIVAIVYMGFMFVVTIGLLIGLLVLRAKLREVQRKLDRAKSVLHKGDFIFKFAKYFARG